MMNRFLTVLMRLSRHQRGAVIVEFAIIAPIILLFNILVYDVGVIYLLRERSQHSGQVIHQILTSDADHSISIADLERMNAYRSAILDQSDNGIDTALVVIDAIPLSINGGWNFFVCWSWSSNPSLERAPNKGTFLTIKRYHIGPWVPLSGTTSSFANLIVEVHEQLTGLLDLPIGPRRFSHKYEGPIRYVPNLPINLMLYEYPGGTIQNDKIKTDPGAGNALACRR